MDPLQIFATGGASGLAGLVIFLCFRFLQSRHHLVSKCTKDGITVTADATSPKIILSPVEDAQNHSTNCIGNSGDSITSGVQSGTCGRNVLSNNCSEGGSGIPRSEGGQPDSSSST